MKIVLISVVVFWTIVAVRGLVQQGPAHFWRTITGKAAIVPDEWGRWALPVLVMRYTFTPALLGGLVILMGSLYLLGLILESVGVLEKTNGRLYYDCETDEISYYPPYGHMYIELE